MQVGRHRLRGLSFLSSQPPLSTDHLNSPEPSGSLWMSSWGHAYIINSGNLSLAFHRTLQGAPKQFEKIDLGGVFSLLCLFLTYFALIFSICY